MLHLVAALECVDCDKVKLVQSLVRRGAAIEAREFKGKTPLMVAAIHSNDAVASALLQAGADVHAVCNGQRTALHWAADTHSTNTVSLLLAAGASAAAVCAEGTLPLHLACRKFGADSFTPVI